MSGSLFDYNLTNANSIAQSQANKCIRWLGTFDTMPSDWHFCLALGLDDYVSLGTYTSGTHNLDSWGHGLGCNTYRDFYGRSSKRFVEWIGRLVERADEIHFNTDGIDETQASGELDPYNSQLPKGYFVNYELWLVQTTPYASKLYKH